MNPTTSPMPEPEGTAGRPTRLIHNEATTEIPVHLLFRDEAEPRPVPVGPAVVGSRAGTGEQPRVRRPLPARAPPHAEVDPRNGGEHPRDLVGVEGEVVGAELLELTGGP